MNFRDQFLKINVKVDETGADKIEYIRYIRIDSIQEIYCYNNYTSIIINRKYKHAFQDKLEESENIPVTQTPEEIFKQIHSQQFQTKMDKILE